MHTTRSDKRIREHVTALGSEDSVASNRAEVLLIRHYGSRPVDLLIEACESPDEQTRFRAAWILGKARDSRALDMLLRLTDDPSPSVRYDATLALEHLGDPRAIETLIRIMCGPDSTDGASGAAIQALGMLGKAVIPALTELAKSEDPEILLRVAWTLFQLRDEVTVGLAESLAAHPDEVIRTAALEALEWIREEVESEHPRIQ